jgi:hypothetical protein
MKKQQCEAAIRLLCRQWLKAVGHPDDRSFSEFLIWLRFKSYGHYLEFKSVAGAEREARAWFDDEIKQSLRR